MKTKLAMLVLACVLALAACGGTAPEGQGIRGLVLLGPNCPVEQEGVPCPDTPFQTQLAVTDPTGVRVIAMFTSNADGTFEVRLAVGEYAIRSAVQGGLPYCVTDQPFIVSAGSMTEVAVTCDTGIR